MISTHDGTVGGGRTYRSSLIGSGFNDNQEPASSIWSIGARDGGASPSSCRIGEIGAINRVISTAERDALVFYFNQFYGTPL